MGHILHDPGLQSPNGPKHSSNLAQRIELTLALVWNDTANSEHRGYTEELY